jgi:cellulose synthase/poly-beta-1,6-N-acetylglucosamine synthase-like glycosyltransferase
MPDGSGMSGGKNMAQGKGLEKINFAVMSYPFITSIGWIHHFAPIRNYMDLAIIFLTMKITLFYPILSIGYIYIQGPS